jgi:cytochrome c-type biogenesis protein
MENLSPLVAFIGGLASLLSPCILPMVPVYIASISTPGILQGGVTGRRLTVFFQSLSFIVGFSLVFIVLGSGVGFIGFVVGSHQLLVRRITGSLMIVFGLFILAATRISGLNYEKRLSPGNNVYGSYLHSLIIGILFALAWTPCVGPVLGGILSLALGSGSALQGAYLLAFYSLGLALPFLIIGLVFDSILPILKRIARYSIYIYIFSGLLLIIIGILVLIDKLSWFSI